MHSHAEVRLNETEIQLLASLYALAQQDRRVNRSELAQRGEGYWIYLEDWTQARLSLAERKLISTDADCVQLLEDGRNLARDCYAERPDYYWYYFQQFYQPAHQSVAHSRFCERNPRRVCSNNQSSSASRDSSCAASRSRGR